MKRTISLLLVLLLTLSGLSGCGEDSTSASTAPEDPSSNATSAESAKSEAIVIADDEFITATFEKMYDAVSLGVDGVFYIDLNVKNKTNQEIWVYLDKASVNSEMVPLVMSGTPLYILPEKSGRNGFIISFSALSIDKIDDVKNISFDLVVANKESLAEIERVSQVSLDF